jgi:O-antigen/teichoic acid export membrane protein
VATQLQRDLVANAGARFWSMALNLIAVPIYLRHLGAEAYGLVGVMILLENIAELMDSGLGMTLNRELARRAPTDAGEEDTRRSLLATLQAIHVTLAVLSGLLVLACAPLIARRWVQARALDPTTITECLRWMSLAVASAVLFSFYQGGLFGARRQVGVNVITIVFSTLRVGGCMLLLTTVTRAPQAFFATQGITLAGQTLASAILLWRALPRTGQRARFEMRYVREVWRFTVTVSANALLTATVSQIDKVVFSRVLTLAEFGYYTLAGTAGGLLWAAVLPLTAPFFPRFAALWERRALDALADIYHRATQLTTLAVAPLAAVLAAFATPLLLIWTRNAEVAEHAGPIMTLLVAGVACNALASIPSLMQSACGWPGLMTSYNAVYAAVLAPALWLAAEELGVIGALVVWAVPNAGYLFVTTPIMHRRILRGELGTWLRWDVGAPALVAIAVAAACRLAMPPLGRGPAFAYAAATGVVTLAATFLCLGRLRGMAVQRWGDLRRRYA